VRKHFHQLALILVLGSGFALAQTMPSQQPSGSQGSSVPQTQSPSSTDQQPSAQQPSSTAPDKTLPNTDQSTQNSQSSTSSQSDQSSQTGQSSTSGQSSTTGQSGQSLPQSDASASATGNGDVQNNIQSAIQKDPSLANANVMVDVKNGKSIVLTGTVPTKDAKDAAERIARDNSNGMKVKNHLKVASNNTDTNSTNPKGDSNNPK
jgi:osmotically-inducible protein OsmY